MLWNTIWWEMFGMNLANKLTMLRVILVPIFLIFLLQEAETK